jgi:hypothetical protein
MTYSSLIDQALPPRTQKWSARPAGVKINGLNVHHWASTTRAGLDRLVYSSDPASANYLILTDGDLIGSVPEEYRAWTSGSYAADDDKITVEIQNSSGSPDWRISDAAFRTLVRLYADLGKRRGFATDRGHIYGHRQYAATACPGPYLYSRLDDVAAQATALNKQQEEDDDMPSAEEIAKAVWNHEARVPSNLVQYLGETNSMRAIVTAAAYRTEKIDQETSRVLRELAEHDDEVN